MMSDVEIYCYYLGVDTLEVPSSHSSPIRADRTPSFSLFTVHNQEGEEVIMWKDHGDGQKGFAIDLVAVIENVSRKDAYNMVRNNVFKSFSKPQVKQLNSVKKTPSLEIRERWYDFELDYWSKYGITEEQLHTEGVYPCEHLSWSNKPQYYEKSRKDDPIFIYYFDKDFYGKVCWKKYRPKGDKFTKWASWNISDVIEGYSTLKSDGELLLIWKATKDLIIGKYQLGLNIIAPTGETHVSSLTAKKYELSQRFDDIIIMYDADEAGFKGATHLSDLTGWKMVDTRGIIKGVAYDAFKQKKVKIKDFSDVRRFKGLDSLQLTYEKCLNSRSTD